MILFSRLRDIVHSLLRCGVRRRRAHSDNQTQTLRRAAHSSTPHITRPQTTPSSQSPIGLPSPPSRFVTMAPPGPLAPGSHVARRPSILSILACPQPADTEGRRQKNKQTNTPIRSPNMGHNPWTQHTTTLINTDSTSGSLMPPLVASRMPIVQFVRHPVCCMRAPVDQSKLCYCTS